MTGCNPTPSEVAYGKGMAGAARQHAAEMHDKAGQAYEAASAAGWQDWDKEWLANEARHNSVEAASQAREAGTWAWLAERHPERLRAEPERDREAGQ